MNENIDSLKSQIELMRLPYLRYSVTADCNAKCSFCHNEGQAIGLRGMRALQGVREIPIDIATKIADYFEDIFPIVKFTGGEPTIMNNLEVVISIFKERGYTTSMTSNGILLTEDRQISLKRAGLDSVNVSLHTTSEEEYARMYGIKGELSTVIENISTLHKYFDGTSKINFMALPNRNIPDELVPISELSARYKIPISFLTIVNNNDTKNPLSHQIIRYLDREIGIQVNIGESNDNFRKRRILHLRNGAIWEFDDFRQKEYRENAFDNPYCSSCNVRDKCTEGPYALRILSSGTVKPCLIRADNHINIQNEVYK